MIIIYSIQMEDESQSNQIPLPKRPGLKTKRAGLIAGLAAAGALATGHFIPSHGSDHSTLPDSPVAATILPDLIEQESIETPEQAVERLTDEIVTYSGLIVDFNIRSDRALDQNGRKITIADKKRQRSLLEMVQKEIEKYPPHTFDFMTENVRRGPVITFVSGENSFWFAGMYKPVPSNERFALETSIYPNPESGAKDGSWSHEIVIDADVARWPIEQVLNHEIFQSLQTVVGFEEYEDRFINTNPEGLKAYKVNAIPDPKERQDWYDAQYAKATQTPHPHRRNPGFMHIYGEGHPWDDAEIIAQMLLTDPTYVEQTIQNDQILAEKVGIVKEFLFDVTKGKMNDKYWRRLKDGTFTKDFWN